MNKSENGKWELYLSRPFTLFGASLWHQWYASELCKDTFGVNIKNGLFIESPQGIVRYYRKKNEANNFSKGVYSLALKKSGKKLELLLSEGARLNKKAKVMLKNYEIYDLNTVVDFFIKSSLLSGVLPYLVGEVILKKKIHNKKIMELVHKLRKVSYYPKFIKKVVAPTAVRELGRMGISQKGAAELITLQEILEKKKVNLKKRIVESKDGKFFIYENLNGREKITWVKNPLPLIKKIEGVKNKKEEVIKGKSAFNGVATGKVKVVLTNKISGINFNKGDILVSISTNPELISLIKKSGAIVTDEGGITSHAAIIARELKKPCIIGTKIATKVLHEGDLVEVDANKGIVRILKRY